MIPIQITVDGQTYDAQLSDSPTTRDLLGLLPLTLPFSDFNGVEKVAKVPRRLTTEGAPAGADPDVRDIGYYSPSRSLVLYYGEVGYWDGIVRIGRFDQVDLVRTLPDGFEVTIDLAADGAFR